MCVHESLYVNIYINSVVTMYIELAKLVVLWFVLFKLHQ